MDARIEGLKCSTKLMVFAFIIGYIIIGVVAYIASGEIVTFYDGAVEFETRYFELDGMPCYYVSVSGNVMHGGPTCDWSKWSGHAKSGRHGNLPGLYGRGARVEY